VKPRSTQRKNSAAARASHSAGRTNYRAWSGGIAALLAEARRQSARSVNAILTATYWEIGRRIVEFQQQGQDRAEYGDVLLKRLSADLTKQFGRGFGWRNIFQMRAFYLTHQDILSTLSAKSAATTILQTLSAISFPPVLDVQTAVSPQPGKLQAASAKSAEAKKVQTPSGKSSGALIRQTPPAELEICQTVSDKFLPSIYATASRKSEIHLALYLEALCHAFPLSWSHYVRLLSVEKSEARKFYEIESLRGGWSVRQLDRQVSTLFYERTALSKNKAKLLAGGAKARPEDAVSVEEEIKNPYVLEFLNLRDDYAENELEDALVRHLEAFLLELGNNFTFVARQKRIRVGKEWYRIDLLLFHRRLRCLVIIDLKVGRFTHADAGQMNLYVNYAAEHLTLADENPPVGLVLCSEHDEAVAYYAMGNLRNKILAAQYKLNLPDPRTLELEIEKMRRLLESPARRLH
jgi:predicted nuclease of restriction endonuclease-like (RecB) superfamily